MAKIATIAAMPNIHELLAINLRKYRQEKGLTQEELAAESGVASEYISRLEAGKRNPTVAIVEKLAKAMKLPVRMLFAEE
ncbi:MAG: helix-turn-helix transcriptional regulator [Bradyrhizobiaceae bacterium]|nr:helix-turn-helix transcriptional regulator [Bradyrhizobiaceae bacterium]